MRYNCDMDGHSFFRMLRNRPVLAFVGGFAIAGIAIGLIVLFTLFWVEPMSAPEQAGTVRFNADHFTLWYQKGGQGVSSHGALSEELQQDLSDLISLLQVNPDLIPGKIDVFIHDDVASMQSSIASRKSPNSRGGYIAPLDLLVGEPPRQRLAELVLAFGWGECGSQLLKQGMALYAADPKRNFHAVVAALPKRLYYSLPELILMEKRGRFAESAYDQFDSPYSTASILFADLRDLLSLSAHGEASLEDIAGLEAASFVQFVIETEGGIGAVKQAWGRGSTDSLISRIDSAPLAEIGRAWYSYAGEHGKESSDFSMLTAYYRLAAGYPDTAWTECSAWDESDLTQGERMISVRCALAVGKFADAQRLVSQLDEGDKREELMGFSSLYTGWIVQEATGVRLFISPQLPAEERPELSVVEKLYNGMADRLALSAADLPERITLFFYPNAGDRDAGIHLVPLSEEKNATLHLVPSDDVALELARTLPVYAWRRDTYSQLLREGLAIALSREASLLEAQGRSLRSEGSWYPLASVDYGMTADSTVALEGGILMNYLLDECGGGAVRDVWIATSPSGRYISFDSALAEICHTTRKDIEEVLFRSILSLRKDQ